MTITIQATAISADDIMQSLTPEARAALKGKRAVAYTIAEEGTSKPRVVGEGPKLLRWPRAVIRRITDSVKAGTKLFERHNKDSSHEGRATIGEVVGSFTRAVGDKLQAVAVGILTEDRPDLDVCSIEADVQVSGEIVGDVEAVTGIALSSSKIDSPAFPGAQRLAMLQCFNDPDNSGSHISNAGETGKPGEGRKTMATFEEVKAFVREHNVFPNQLYSLDEMKNDRTYGPMLAEGETAKAKAATLETEKADLMKKSTEAIRKGDESAAKDRFEKLIPQGATPKQKAFYLSRFNPSRLEKLDDAALNTYLEVESKEYADMVKLLGVAEEAPAVPSVPGAGPASVDPVEAALKEVIGGKS